MNILTGKNGPKLTLNKSERTLLNRAKELCHTIQTHAGSHPGREDAGECYKALFKLERTLEPQAQEEQHEAVA